MATNKITKAKIMSYADENVFSILNNRTYVPDPRNRGSNGRFIYRNDPYSKSTQYDSYPYIILRFPTITQDGQNLSNTVKDVSWTQQITVRTSMGGSVNDNTSTAITNMRDIVDDIIETFNSKAIKDELRLLSMYNINIEITGNDDFEDDNGKHIFEMDLEIQYETRININS